MIKDFLLPDLGEGIESAEVSEILVSSGDEVEVNQTLFVLESDKASMEIPAEVSGVVKEVLIKVGDEIKTGQLLLKVETQDQESKKEISDSTKTTKIENSNREVFDFLLPDLGEGIESAEVSEILVSSGDEVEVNQTLFVLESDKASMEIPAEVSGVVKEVLIKVGDEIKTGQLLLKIETQLKDTKEKNTTIKEKVELPSMDNETTTTNAQVLVEDSSYSEGSKSLASPGVRKLARELGIQLSSIKSTGKGGRLTKEDLLTFIKAKIASGGLKDTDKIPKVDFSAWGELETKKLTRVNKITGQRLQQAWQTIPHVVQYDEADITDLNSYRKEIKERESKKGVKITFLPFLMKACVKTLEKHPTFNSSLDIEENNLIIKKYYNIGIAVDTKAGLVVPVIKDVDQKNIVQLSKELVDLSSRAKDKKLKPEEMKGGTFTISSLGGISGTGFSPIVNPPEVAIMGVSKSQHRPVYFEKTKTFEPRLVMPFSISYDHRVIDGATAARFTATFATALSDVSVFKD